jgi:hypothetical protein
MFWMEVGDRKLLIAGALDPAEDFVLIGGAPVGGGCERNRSGPLLRGFLDGLGRRGYGTRGNFEKSGFLFSMNACFPSRPSSLM